MPPEAVRVGDELGDRYRLLRRVGRGSSATVFEALDTSLERRVAIKVLHPQLSADVAFLERFRNESQAVAALSHGNVMAVHDWGEDSGTPYLVTELLAGGSLRAVFDSGAALSPSQTIGLGLEACRGLNYAHSEGLVHRDITPANLLYASDGGLRIADFGLAKAFAAAGWTSQGTNLVGTARYASPEQASGQRLSSKSDVYSLGLILVEALTGSAPFSADTLLGTLTARVESDVPIPDAPERLQMVLRAMTLRDPEGRPSAEQAGVALLKAAEGLPRPKPIPLVGLPEEADQPEPEPPASNATIQADPDATQLLDPDVTQVGGAPVVQDDPDQVRRWPWLLVTVALIAAGGWFGYQQILNAEVLTAAVPDVVGLSSEEAIEELGDVWELDEKFERTLDVAAGEIIMTDPVAGTQVAEGDVVSYWISLGRPLVRVPVNDLIGRSQAQVEVTIEALDLTVGNVERVNSEDVGAGSVIEVVIPASELQQGEPVDLVVSGGPQDRVIPEAGSVADAPTFIATLEAVGLLVEQSRAFDDDVAANEFITIDPSPGTAVERGSTVTVVISDGPVPVAIPPTAGLGLGEALDRLESAGFLAGALEGSANAACSVVGTDPPEGAEIQPGTSVAVILSECGDG